MLAKNLNNIDLTTRISAIERAIEESDKYDIVRIKRLLAERTGLVLNLKRVNRLEYMDYLKNMKQIGGTEGLYLKAIMPTGDKALNVRDIVRYEVMLKRISMNMKQSIREAEPVMLRLIYKGYLIMDTRGESVCFSQSGIKYLEREFGRDRIIK